MPKERDARQPCDSHSPIAPWVLLSLRTPNATVGKMQAKYRKKMVDIVFWIVFRPTTPAVRFAGGEDGGGNKKESDVSH